MDAPFGADDLDGRVCLVTGATSGIGKEIARGLARQRARVVVASRDAAQGQRVARELGESSGNAAVESLEVDLSSTASIRRFAAEFDRRFRELHVLVLNAGMWPVRRETSVDGIERTWATNVLGYFLPAVLLEDKLTASAPSRVVVVSSDMATGLDLDDVQFERRRYDAGSVYKQSKQAGRKLAWALADRLRSKGVTVNAMHPGVVGTNIIRGGGMALIYPLAKLFMRSPAQGADTAVWLASSRDVKDKTAGYFFDRKEKPCAFRDAQQVERLWKLCEQMTQ